MRVIKANGIYKITLLDEEVDNIISVSNLTPMIGCFREIRDNLEFAREYGICDEWLKDWSFLPAK